MCTVCGCRDGEVRVEGRTLHDHDHHTAGAGRQQQGLTPAHAHAAGMSRSRMVQVEQDILGRNNADARSNRRLFRQRGVLALNLVSSPGSGKTALLVRTLIDLAAEVAMAVIEGDQDTSLDADRVRATGARSVQLNTGKGCHLDAHTVGHALRALDPVPRSILFIENVGNLVCPAGFDLGEAHKVVILSVTEGEDKPLKYPGMFHAAGLMLINKIDLLPHVEFAMLRCIEAAQRVNPGLQVLQVSAHSGEGLGSWYAWLRLQLQGTRRREAG